MSPRSNLLFCATLLSAVSLQATSPSCRPLNSFEQGRDLRQSQMTAGYNATARTDVRGSWDVYTTGGYIFWQPRAENLELGLSNKVNDPVIIDGNSINMNYHYKSGFKLGLGVFTEQDNWDAYAEYTWLSGHQSVRATAPTSGLINPFWGAPSTERIISGKSRWKLDLNIIDVMLARSYYVGSKLTFRPFFAGRAAWINQKYIAVYTQSSQVPYQSNYSSHSWGLGPEVGLSSNWLLGYGIRAIGSAEADILFTRYNLHTTEETPSDPTQLDTNWRQRRLGCLRPHANIELGFGWETYFNNHNYHVDILGTYGFQVFWNQSMFLGHTQGDLYIHGATGEVRFDF